MDVDEAPEISAFEMYDPDEEEEKKAFDADDVKKARAQQLAEREAMEQKYSILNVDSSAVKYYFKSLKNVSTDEESFWNMIEVMTEIIITEYDNDEDDTTRHLMCIRGLLMLVLNQQLSRDRGQMTATRILT